MGFLRFCRLNRPDIGLPIKSISAVISAFYSLLSSTSS
ncbi:hypothetical protein HMPREF1502_3967 [Klebsiella sp. AS10]|nr:hypothetical protein HMPREF1502_3967 [Klebsiella sp. AS10]